MPILPGQKVELSSNPKRTLCITLNALCRAEEVTGTSFLAGEIAFQNLRSMRAILWAGLLHESPDLTLLDAGNIIDEVGMEHAFNCVAEAMIGAMPQGEDEQEGSETSDPPSP